MSDSDLPVQRNLTSLCEEFEKQWNANEQSDIKLFLSRVDSGHRDQLLGKLIEIDVRLRRNAGQQISPQDYTDLGQQAVVLASRIIEAAEPPGPYPVKPSSTDDELATRSAMPQQAKNSRIIGNYKLLQVLGEGGMGTVWMAEQEKPVRRRVALKLIKASVDNKQVVARFEAERQALAMMDHQNIAKVLDAGTTENGQPFFVMELVQGIPFTKYCDQNQLSINERLELFIPVCKAVQHAHQKGIIHRDIKPSNVLVGLHDGKPVPKVIDFGLAKALQHQSKLTDKTLFTEFGQVVGTLQYMSPEQAELNQLDIDTRTDIYSLGVMLYELLTGSTPIEADTLKNHAILQVLATIRDREPPRPSVRLSSSTNDAVTGISRQRQIDPAKLKNILYGELDWIVMKALEKDRTRRYETANGFAEDVEHYLNNEVVTARPPSRSYQLQKYFRKNRGFVITVASIAMLVLLGIAGTGYGMVRAKLESNKRIAAEFARTAGESDRRSALQARDIAIAAKQKEAEAFEEAERQRQLAESAQKEAIISEQLALDAKQQADYQRQAAEQQRALEQARAVQQETVIAALTQSTLKLLCNPHNNESSSISTAALETLRNSWDRSSSIPEVRLLALGEFRAGEYSNSLKYGLLSISLASSQIDNSAPHPVDLGIVAMSHCMLGENDEANEFRNQFNEAMKLDAFKENDECHNFAKEVDQFFAEKPKAGTDK